MIEISIIPFEEKFVKNFYDLNVEWLEKFFYVEPYDEKVLSNPKTYIIDKGGFIFFAKYKDEIVGTVAIINQNTFFELSKMAVLPKYHGQKIGQQLIDYCLNFSKNKGWKNIMLYSNRILEPAIALYKKVGFKEVSLEKDVYYERANIKMKLEL
tara:strand:- start:365 stop:826 length:462 start_codon:yes stop_codon:yes gene_type:complete